MSVNMVKACDERARVVADHSTTCDKHDAAWDDHLSASLAMTRKTTSAVCFTAGTLIATIDGLRKVEDLQQGDLILTMDSGYKPLCWLGHCHLDTATLDAAERLRPIRIKARALGRATPERDLLLSPQHRVLLRSSMAYDLCGDVEVLVSARDLTCLDGIDVAWDHGQVTYYHLMFDQHEIVYANGTPSESLYLGKSEIASLTEAARQELLEIFPQLEDEAFQQHVARFSPGKLRDVQELLDRVSSGCLQTEVRTGDGDDIDQTVSIA